MDSEKLTDMVLVPLERLEELVKAETTLKILCRMIAHKAPYEIKTFRSIAGEELIPIPEKESEGE